ncbi:MAG: transposase [Candidatus Cloacimonetes bacterium]|nr:transposase [Candidatus Cloacimonadota bacterium]
MIYCLIQLIKEYLSLNPAKVNEYDYINFLLASSKVFTCTEAERCSISTNNSPSHDAFTRLLQRQPQNTEALWNEVKSFINPKSGYLSIDDSTLDKHYSQNIELVTHHWSGNHHKVVQGINLITLLWTDGNLAIPVDYRIYNRESDGKTKNDHFSDMMMIASKRGFNPDFVLFDSWYSTTNNLKTLRNLNWNFLTRLKSNRIVNPDKSGNVSINSLEIPLGGMIVHLKAYGFIRIFVKYKDHAPQFWATDLLGMKPEERDKMNKVAWKIENYHRALKQFCGVDKCQARKEVSQRSHIQFSLRVYLRLEINRIKKGKSWFETKMGIHRDAVANYINNPKYSI